MIGILVHLGTTCGACHKFGSFSCDQVQTDVLNAILSFAEVGVCMQKKPL